MEREQVAQMIAQAIREERLRIAQVLRAARPLTVASPDPDCPYREPSVAQDAVDAVVEALEAD